MKGRGVRRLIAAGTFLVFLVALVGPAAADDDQKFTVSVAALNEADGTATVRSL